MSSPEISHLRSEYIAPLFWTPERLNRESCWWGHVPFAFWITAICRPQILVELGTQHGVSYAAFCEGVVRSRLETRCYAVDTWEGDPHAGFYGESVYDDFKEFHDKRYASFSELLRKSFDDACVYFEDGAIDLLHIDGYHTYEAVRHDFETWRPKLSDRAVVLFHDTNARGNDFGVWRYFGELKEKFSTFEFLHCHGLGVVVVGAKAPAEITDLCGLTQSDDIAALRERFSHLGARWMAVADENAALAAQLRQTEEFLAQKEAQVAQSEDSLTLSTKNSEALAARLRQFEESLAQANDLIAKANDIIAHVSRRYAEKCHGQPKTNFFQIRRAKLKRLLSAFVTARKTRKAKSLLSALAEARKKTKSHSQLSASGERDLSAIRNSVFFDAEFYLNANPDVKATGLDPALHYFQYGGSEGRNPSPAFSTNEYLSNNPDITAAGINALAHYELHGRVERRRLI